MREVVGGVVINEVESEPLSEYVIDFLVERKKECPYLDFKYTIHIEKNSDFPEIAKDIFAFSNYGGGWILIGWKEIKSNQYVPEGLPEDYNVDQATLQEKFNSYSNYPIELSYQEFTKYSKRLAAIYIPPSYHLLKPTKDGIYKKRDKDRMVFKRDDVFYRRGTQSIPPSEKEIEIISQTSCGAPRSRAGGACEAPPHKNRKRLADSVPMPDFMHFIPTAELWGIAIK